MVFCTTIVVNTEEIAQHHFLLIIIKPVYIYVQCTHNFEISQSLKAILQDSGD